MHLKMPILKFKSFNNDSKWEHVQSAIMEFWEPAIRISSKTDIAFHNNFKKIKDGVQFCSVQTSVARTDFIRALFNCTVY